MGQVELVTADPTDEKRALTCGEPATRLSLSLIRSQYLRHQRRIPVTEQWLSRDHDDALETGGITIPPKQRSLPWLNDEWALIDGHAFAVGAND